MINRHLEAQIDLSAIFANLNLLKSASPDAKVCAAVKANAYGHGVDIVVPALISKKVDMLAVSNFTEAQELLEIDQSIPILVLGSELSIYDGAAKDEIADWLVENEIRTTPMMIEDLNAISKSAKKLGKKAYVHIKLDTGMSRMGHRQEQLWDIVNYVAYDENIVIEGLYTHLATADALDKSFTMQQLRVLEGFKQALEAKNIDYGCLHFANSAVALTMDCLNTKMIRPGLALYGYYNGPHDCQRPAIKPAMRVVSYLTAIKPIPAGSFIGYGCSIQAERDMTVAIVPIGYGDGYDRKLSNRGKMKISGQYVPIVGRISMDQSIVDVTELSGSVRPGTEVVVIDNDPDSENSVENLACLLDTIPYEITTRLGPRIKRVAVK